MQNSGERGFKTLEMQLLGPTLTIAGVLFVLLRILFCSIPGCADVVDGNGDYRDSHTRNNIDTDVTDQGKHNSETERNEKILLEEQQMSSYIDSPVSEIDIEGSFLNIKTTALL